MSHSAFTLQPPVVDDTMEISSDRGHVDEDIDIDFDQDLELNHQQYSDDDQMVDDVKDHGLTTVTEQTDVGTNDDIMVEDALSTAAEENDGIMQDDLTLQEHDEELLDFTDVDDNLDIEPTYHEEIISDEHIAPIVNVDDDFDGVDYTESAEDAVVVDTAHDVGLVDPPPNVDAQPDAESQLNHHDTLAPEDEITDETAEDIPSIPEPTAGNDKDAHDVHALTAPEDHPDGNEVAAEQPARQQRNDLTDSLSLALEAGEEPPQSHPTPLHLDTQVSTHEEDHDAADVEESRGTPTWTGLHPTIVRYQGSEVALFPSGDPLSAEQYFLEDENLVNGSIGDMLQACRVVLGESITEDDELEISVDDLGLCLSEVCHSDLCL